MPSGSYGLVLEGGSLEQLPLLGEVNPPAFAGGASLVNTPSHLLTAIPKGTILSLDSSHLVASSPDLLSSEVRSASDTGPDMLTGLKAAAPVAGSEAQQFAVTRTSSAPEATISSNPSQTFKGWGFTPTPRYNTLVDRPQIAEAIYSLEPDFVRFALDDAFNADGSINAVGVDKLASNIKIAKDYGTDQYILSLWSPPSSYKNTRVNAGFIDKNGNRRYDTGETRSTLLPQYEDAFVASYVNALEALRSRGVELPMAISIQNEGDWSPFWAGNQYSGEQWRRVVKKMRAGFDEAGLSKVVIHGPESGGYLSAVAGASYLGSGGYSQLAADSELNRAVGAYALHSYNRGKIGDNRQGMERFPKDAWMTEWSIPGGKSQLDWAINDARHLMSDLVALPFNYWAWWWAWTPQASGNGESLISGSSNPTFTKPYHVFDKLWDTVDPGWTVHQMSTEDPRLKDKISGDEATPIDMLAFENPNGTASAVLLTNPTDAAITLEVDGLKGQRLQVFRTTATEDMSSQGVDRIENGAASVSLPARSIVFLSTTGGTAATPQPQPTPAEPEPAPTPDPELEPIRIDSGSSSAYTTAAGQRWQPDAQFFNGKTADRGRIEITNTVDDGLYQTERYGMSGYNIPVRNGTYQVRLHFAETYEGVTAAGQRVFNVNVEGKAIASLDVFQEAGGRNRALVKTSVVDITDGNLNLDFEAVQQLPIINGIEVIPVVES
jgi:O-glycosyl hydrolase